MWWFAVIAAAQPNIFKPTGRRQPISAPQIAVSGHTITTGTVAFDIFEAQYIDMASQSLRSVLILRGIVAHFVGLGAVSFWVAVQIDSFPVLGTTVEGMILGAILASPWATAMLGIFWFATTWLDKNSVIVCLLGPILVWASAYALVVSGYWLPEKYMEPVMVASVVASAVYFVMHVLRQRRIADT